MWIKNEITISLNDLGKKPIHTTILFTKYRATDTTQILSIFFLLKCGIFFGDVNVARDLCINKFRFALILLVILLLVALLLKSDRSMPTVRKLAEIDEFMALKTKKILQNRLVLWSLFGDDLSFFGEVLYLPPTGFPTIFVTVINPWIKRVASEWSHHLCDLSIRYSNQKNSRINCSRKYHSL